MRRVTAVSLVVASVMLLTAQPAEAQGFWRWLERLSGPEISGPGFDAVLICRGLDRLDPDETTTHWFISPQCVDARRDRFWISVGAEVYALAGDNNQTADPDDRVDAFGILPFVDLNTPMGLSVGAGVGMRRYSAGTGPFKKATIEAMVKWRPFATLAGREARQAAPSLLRDFLELRVGLVYQGHFEEGRFGPGTPALESDVSPVLILAFNLLK